MSELFALSDEVEVREPRGTFDPLIVSEVWETAETISGNDSALWRKDEYGNTICRSEYGNTGSSFGWEIVKGLPGELKPRHIDQI
ncbi:MAG: hypothetical protein P1V20_31325 [Verrucomicrobiales bacterium]|nr:hypothetical protein [Verrucomicrobiales bacterium]